MTKLLLRTPVVLILAPVIQNIDPFSTAHNHRRKDGLFMYLEALSNFSIKRAAANAAWHAERKISQLLPTGRRNIPAWATGPLLRSHERTSPPLGVPRVTKSLCPRCNAEIVKAVLDGEATVADFSDRPGIIEAHILEEGGRILMRKSCRTHGEFQDVLSTNPAFFKRMESLYVGQDFSCSDDGHIHNHGPSTIRTGRGIVLIVDLTNRCNLKCSPCYMDANHTTYVHEPPLDDVKRILNRALSAKPHREMIVLFAGGEPTIAHAFLDAVRCARDLGFKRVAVATNGTSFADEEFAVQARAAGLHQVFLQIQGTSDEANQHLGAINLFDVKRRALENIAKTGMRASLQIAVGKTVNDHEVGDIVQFALRNIDKIQSVIFQPVMFAGRDANIQDEDRFARRYTLADLAEGLSRQSPDMQWTPMRDWFPMSIYGVFANLFDVLNPRASVGSLYTDMHPNHSIFSPLLVNQRTGQVVPISSFLNVDQLLKDIVHLTDSGCRPTVIKAGLVLSVLRNFDASSAPRAFSPRRFVDLFASFEPRLRSDGPDWDKRDNSDPEWRILTIVGQAFQDGYNYDLSAIQMDATPVATLEGEISFCTYNAAGWRKIDEHLHKTATLSEWYRKHGRHKIFTNGAVVKITSGAFSEGTSTSLRDEALELVAR